MPRDRLTFTIRVSREDQAVGRLGGIDDGLYARSLVAIKLPVHREVLIRADGTVLHRQIADVAVGREDLEAGTEILLDGLGLGRGFDNDKLHEV